MCQSPFKPFNKTELNATSWSRSMTLLRWRTMSTSRMAVLPEGGGTFSIRGLTGGGGGLDSSTSLNVDGVQVSRGWITHSAFMDLESVEILKGPQALFYGKNSPAGVVTVRGARPTDEFEMKLQASYEPEAGETLLEVVLSGPLTETLRGRVAFRGEDMNSWFKNTAQFTENSNGEIYPLEPYDLPGGTSTPLKGRTYTTRVTLDWLPTDQFTATLRALNTNKDTQGAVRTEVGDCGGDGETVFLSFNPFPDPYADCKLDGKISWGSFPVEIAEAWGHPDARNGHEVGANWREYDSWVISLNMDYELEWATINSVTGWLWYHGRGLENTFGLLFPTLSGYNPDEHEQITQEIRLTTQLDGPVNYMFGAYYEEWDRRHESHSKIIPFGLDPITGISNDTGFVSDLKGNSWSVFGQVIWNINEQWELTAGARYQDEEVEGEQFTPYMHSFWLGFGPFNPWWEPADGVLFARQTDTNVSPEVTLTWRPTDNHTFWAAYKTGYKSAGYSTPTLLSANESEESITVRPEEAWGFEVGTKSTFLDGRLRVNTTAYFYTFENLQLSQLDIETLTFQLDNAGEAETKGIEFDILFAVTDELEVYFEGGFNDGEFTEYRGAPCYFQQAVDEGCGVDLDGDGILEGVQDLSGFEMTNAPTFAGSVGFEFIRALNGQWSFGLAAEAQYKSEFVTDIAHHPLAIEKDKFRLNARVSLNSSDGRWGFAVIGRNLTDEVADLGGTRPGGISLADRAAQSVRPASYTFQVTYSL